MSEGRRSPDQDAPDAAAGVVAPQDAVETRCPRGAEHEVAPFWFTEDPTTRGPRGIICLWCDDAVVTFDPEAEARVARRRAKRAEKARA